MKRPVNNREDAERRHARLPDKVPRNINPPTRIDGDWTEAIKSLFAFRPPRNVPDERAADWTDAGNGLIRCPYCLAATEPSSRHWCEAVTKTFVVPAFPCRMWRVVAKEIEKLSRKKRESFSTRSAVAVPPSTARSNADP